MPAPIRHTILSCDISGRRNNTQKGTFQYMLSLSKLEGRFYYSTLTAHVLAEKGCKWYYSS